MTLLKIAHIGHPVLREPTATLSKDELASDAIQTFIDDLIETKRDANGAGLAANQVHRSVRICAVEVADNPRYPYKPNVPLTVVVNPIVDPVGDRMFDNYEGCLSVPNLRGMVPRYCEIRLRGLDRHGNAIDRQIRGLTAGTFQHEIDHLDGKLFVDRVVDSHTLCTWDQYKRHHEHAFVERIKKLVAEYGS